ncbi:diaminopimelate epimerase [Alkalimarinus sediminis]|uniref:Diaminopimelate epimerase n=1 Tax=Alkalimarinus sediminis TaxID=1632866 RepID=A0A9E8KPF9_9ALTE|nr:diaminopimelate epimerase [Alkalimarinus sediminis]UZW74704.1 diaminopimelate epimerase [Alkalimarinus sediminis]
MLIKFTKMHGLGNDFMVVDMISQHAHLRPEQVKKLSDRHFGIGFDQLLIVEPPGRPDVDFRYRIFNADGGEVEQCGNGARCFARYVIDNKLTSKSRIRVETSNGIIELEATPDGRVVVDMGAPILTPESIPFVADSVAAEYELMVPSLDSAEEERVIASAVSMGNPHCVLLTDDIKTAPVETLGPLLESHERFPNRVNVGFMEIIHRRFVHLRVYERGVGETMACGTGACAAVVAGQLRGLLDASVEVKLPGGNLQIEWLGEGHSVMMKGPATKVFEGQVRV